jgi:hypothetical protein
MKWMGTRLGFVLWCFFAAGVPQTFAQGVITSGYAIITPITPSKVIGAQLMVEQDRGQNPFDVTVAPSDVSDSFMLPLSRSSLLNEDLGIAIVNPQDKIATVSIAVTAADGQTSGAPISITIPARGHVSNFFGQGVFGRLPPSEEFAGAIQISSGVPISVLGLRFHGADFNPIIAVPAGARVALPRSGSSGGEGAVLLPHVVFGGTWYSEVTVLNPNPEAVDVRLDVFDTNGQPWLINLNDKVDSSFVVRVPAKGVFAFTSPKQKALRAGRKSAITVVSLPTAIFSQIGTLTTTLTSLIAAGNLTDAQKAQVMSQIAAQTSAALAAFQRTFALGSQIAAVMTQLRNTEDPATIMQIQSSINAFTPQLLREIEVLLTVQTNLVNLTRSLSGPGPIPLPPIMPPPLG